MEFSSLRIKDIDYVVLHRSVMKRWEAKNRSNHIVGILLEGSASHDFGYQNFVIKRNCIYFLNQRDDYRVNVHEQTTALSIHFTTDEIIDTESFCIPISTPDEIALFLKKAKTASETGDALMALSYLYRFCARIDQVRQKAYFPKDNRMTIAKEYIDLHYTEKSCLETALEQSGLTARRFGELFRNSFDITPNKYITLKKINYAKSLLETNAFSVTDAAQQSGFSDIYYFSKVFKKILGVLPSKWKEN